jgi:uncharacterized protein
LFPDALLSLEPIGDGLAPRYLRSRDDVWVRRAVSEFADLAGMPRGAIDDAWASRIEPALRSFGAPRIATLGIRRVLDRACTWHVRAALEPSLLRESVFPIAASDIDREVALARASAQLGLSAREVESGLFADRVSARALVMPSLELAPRDIVLAYNMALVQGILLRAECVCVDVSESVRAVVRYAKLKGLLASFEVDESGWTRMRASGPLALFQNTLKYGHALAGFFPTLTATPRYRVEATCRIREQRVVVRIYGTDPLPRTHALPREVDSAVERALVRDIRRLGSAWTIERETAILRAGSKLFFPDYALVRGAFRVLVEIVGYYTQEYLARKAEALRIAGCVPMVVCVDDALDCGEGFLAGCTVLRFRRRVDAAQLVAIAEKIALSGPCPERPRGPLIGG